MCRQKSLSFLHAPHSVEPTREIVGVISRLTLARSIAYELAQSPS